MTKVVHKIGIVLLIAVAIVGIAGCAPAAPEAHEVVNIEILSDQTGSSGYIFAVAAAEILNKYHPWIRASALETTGSATNIEMGHDRDPNTFMMVLAETTLEKALKGEEPFTHQYTNIRWINGLEAMTDHFTTLDPDIKTIADFKGKRIALKPKPFGSTPVFLEVLDYYGVNYDTATIEHMWTGDAHEALADGLVDIAIVSAVVSVGKATPQPFVEELLFSKGDDLYFIELPYEAVTYAYEKAGVKWGLAVTPPLTYSKNQLEPLEGMKFIFDGYGVYADADEELIYEITKTLVEHAHEFRLYHPMGRLISSESMATMLPIRSEAEMHPGALRYYKETGLWPGEAFFAE